MASSNAIASVGAQILKSDVVWSSGQTPSSLSYTKIGDVENVNDISINTDTGQANILDGSGWNGLKPLNHSIPPISMDIFYVPTDSTQQGCLADQIARTKRWFKVALPSGDAMYIPGYVTKTTISLQTNTLIKGKLEISPDGQPNVDDLTS